MAAEYRKSRGPRPEHTVVTSFYVIVDTQLSLLRAIYFSKMSAFKKGPNKYVNKGKGTFLKDTYLWLRALYFQRRVSYSILSM